jgi:Acetyl esterase (deacetylase)
MSYEATGYYPNVNANPGYAEFVLSIRGQGFLMPGNIYNNWIVWGLDSKENYYYRGAYMDLVRGVDFLVSRPEIDSERIVAEGGSQGGALTMAACALDHRIAAGAPQVPFLSDFRDYFEIVDWPRSRFDRYLEQHPNDNWDRIYDLLSYFDIKNLSPRIKCPIIMGVGLQDNICPPHTNFAGYNQITGEKNYRIYHDQWHSVGAGWREFRTEFFNRVVGL